MATGGADDGDFNPIEKIGLFIVPVLKEGERDDGEQQPAAQPHQERGGEEAVQNLSLQAFHLQQIVGDMRNKMNLLFAEQPRHISTVNTNIHHIRAFRGNGMGVVTAAVAPRGCPVVPHLSKCPQDLFILGREWEQGIEGWDTCKAVLAQGAWSKQENILMLVYFLGSR